MKLPGLESSAPVLYWTIVLAEQILEILCGLLALRVSGIAEISFNIPRELHCYYFLSIFFLLLLNQRN